MKFIDEVTIEIAAGNGGSGSRHFRREKFVPLGGPDGGNGGSGGSVIFYADSGVHTLLDFRHRPQWQAPHGAAGDGGLRDGKSGADLRISVPIGTEILDSRTGELLCDLVSKGQEFVAAQGGRGGKGNAFFKSATNRAPDHFQPGEPGAQRTVTLSLKLVADVGLVGLPNAGKSTLISRISAARPKIADYPFTTLVPNLGVVGSRGKPSFVVADIPGLIPGAHLGKGLGTKFLKHIARTKLIVHLIDPFQYDQGESPRPIGEIYGAIRTELHSFSDELAHKPEIVALTKADTSSDRDALNLARRELETLGCEVHCISSVSGEGVDSLVAAITIRLSQLGESAGSMNASE